MLWVRYAVNGDNSPLSYAYEGARKGAGASYLLRADVVCDLHGSDLGHFLDGGFGHDDQAVD